MTDGMLHIGDVEVVDTFAEAFPMNGARVIVTAQSRRWADEAARSATGFATSVIGCKCEAGIERDLDPSETPDGRPGVSLLIFAMSREDLGKRLVDRVGQSVMTCPTTSAFDGLSSVEDRRLDVGGQLRYFGDGFQASKVIGGRRFWRIPVMEGEFLCEETFGAIKGVGGGNLIVLGPDQPTTLRATEAAADAIRGMPGVIMPFPGGIVRSGSKVGARTGKMPASTNDGLSPTLRIQAPETQVGDGHNSVLEIVIDGLSEKQVHDAMRAGLHAAAANGASRVTCGNYGGDLGPFHFPLREMLDPEPPS